MIQYLGYDLLTGHHVQVSTFHRIQVFMASQLLLHFVAFPQLGPHSIKRRKSLLYSDFL